MNKKYENTIFEKGRSNAHFKYSDTRNNKRYDWSNTEQPHYESMRKRYKTTYEYNYTHYNTNVLEKWLYKQIGENWDTVYSKAVHFTNKKHHKFKLLKILKSLVIINVFIDNGKLVYHKNKRYYGDILEVRHNDLYVNENNTLCCHSQKCYISKKKRKVLLYESLMKTSFINGNFLFEKINGIWHHFYLDKQKILTYTKTIENNNGEIIKKQYTYKKYRTGNEIIHNGVEVSPINKTQCNKKILKAFQIKNE